ncbi:MAG TPA: RdgB/HAM1 family non-canonical purine NTP pyrophosphatase [Gemmatimonadaceae bacterium]|nr:RdgB/HAM1 family non-canonical purine NTP pyrophosphatase [Gemmatimonadaceae bacterium]
MSGRPASPLVLATRSLGKLHELGPMLAAYGIDIMTLADAGVVEDPRKEEDLERFETFEENALAKARYFFERVGRRPTVADDSGLEVLALGGRPGVRTKRWSSRSDLSGRALDAANNAKMLSELAGVADRRARYVCVAAYIDGESERVFRGESTGRILEVPRGTGGFGYDPLFLSDDLGVTFAEASREQKERVSHRGRAFAQLAEWMSQRASPR